MSSSFLSSQPVFEDQEPWALFEAFKTIDHHRPQAKHNQDDEYSHPLEASSTVQWGGPASAQRVTPTLTVPSDAEASLLHLPEAPTASEFVNLTGVTASVTPYMSPPPAVPAPSVPRRKPQPVPKTTVQGSRVQKAASKKTPRREKPPVSQKITWDSFLQPVVPEGVVANPGNHGRWEIDKYGNRTYLNQLKAKRAKPVRPQGPGAGIIVFGPPPPPPPGPWVPSSTCSSPSPSVPCPPHSPPYHPFPIPSVSPSHPSLPFSRSSPYLTPPLTPLSQPFLPHTPPPFSALSSFLFSTIDTLSSYSLLLPFSSSFSSFFPTHTSALIARFPVFYHYTLSACFSPLLLFVVPTVIVLYMTLRVM